MTTRKVINRFLTIYESAKDNEYVQKPLSYALYHTWREIDREETPKWLLKEKEARKMSDETFEKAKKLKEDIEYFKSFRR